MQLEGKVLKKYIQKKNPGVNFVGKQIAVLPDEDFDKFLKEEIIKHPIKSRTGISLSFPYSLTTSMKTKMDECSVYHRWTAFLNNSGRLCHVISPETGLLLRVTFKYPIKDLSATRQLEIIKSRVSRWIAL